MRLIKPNPGELADRQTILELKINKANVEFDEDRADALTSKNKNMGVSRVLVNKNAIDVTPFLDELELVRKHLTQNWVPDIANKPGVVEQYDALYQQLSEVNEQLWTLENQIRVLRVAPDKDMDAACRRAQEVAFAIADANDKRSELVKAIDALWGYKTQEKFYV